MSDERTRSRPTERPSSSTRTVQTRRADSVPGGDDAEDGDDRDHPQQRRDVAAGQHQVEHEEHRERPGDQPERPPGAARLDVRVHRISAGRRAASTAQ